MVRLLVGSGKNTWKYYLSWIFGVSVLYFTVYIFENLYFYFTTFLKKIMYFLLHKFSLTPKSTCYILIAKQDRKMVQFTLLTLVWCSGLWDPFSMFTKIKITQLSMFSSWDSLALVHFLWRTCKRTHFHWVHTVHPPTHLYYICGVRSPGLLGNKSVEKCVCRWKQVKMKQNGLLCAFTLSSSSLGLLFQHSTKNVPVSLLVCLSPAFLALFTLCSVWNYTISCGNLHNDITIQYFDTLFRYIVKNSVFPHTLPQPGANWGRDTTNK
jgi:hypothetical protein